MDLTKPLPVVFTAQSKQYFYCRDAVCVFTLNRGRRTIKPFQGLRLLLQRPGRSGPSPPGQLQPDPDRDELWVFGDTIANGVLAEIRYALEHEKPIRFFTISADPKEIRPLSMEEMDQLKAKTSFLKRSAIW